jgi:hypothetical protein
MKLNWISNELVAFLSSRFQTTGHQFPDLLRPRPKMLRPFVTTFCAKNFGKTVFVTTLRPPEGITPHGSSSSSSSSSSPIFLPPSFALIRALCDSALRVCGKPAFLGVGFCDLELHTGSVTAQARLVTANVTGQIAKSLGKSAIVTVSRVKTPGGVSSKVAVVGHCPINSRHSFSVSIPPPLHDSITPSFLIRALLRLSFGIRGWLTGN